MAISGIQVLAEEKQDVLPDIETVPPEPLTNIEDSVLEAVTTKMFDKYVSEVRAALYGSLNGNVDQAHARAHNACMTQGSQELIKGHGEQFAHLLPGLQTRLKQAFINR